MAEASLVGFIWLLLSFIVWVYFTIWLMITPFIDDNHSFNNYFPERKWGIIVPIMIGIIFLTFVFTLAGIALMSEKR